MEDKNISFYKGKRETKVDEQFLKNEMAQYLQMDNLNFLIGAGCSSHMPDGTELGIPGMVSLYKDFFAKYPDFEVMGEAVKDKFDNNLEKMLECMGAIAVSNTIKTMDTDIEDKIKKVQQFIRNK